MKILGIYHPRTKELWYCNYLRKLGFNAITLDPLHEWHIADTIPGLSIEEKQIKAAELMFKKYELLKRMGYVYFLNLGSSWGLGEFDGNYFWKVIGEKFKNCDDVIFDIGEFYEDYVEQASYYDYNLKAKRKLTEPEYYRILGEKFSYFGKRVEIGNTRRNKLRFNADTLTSYEFQDKYWTKQDIFAWIFGQCGWHNLIGSLMYGRKAKQCNKKGIGKAFLYQGNPSAWTVIGFENKILDFFGLREFFESWQRKRFIKKFGSNN